MVARVRVRPSRQVLRSGAGLASRHPHEQRNMPRSKCGPPQSQLRPVRRYEFSRTCARAAKRDSVRGPGAIFKRCWHQHSGSALEFYTPPTFCQILANNTYKIVSTHCHFRKKRPPHQRRDPSRCQTPSSACDTPAERHSLARVKCEHLKVVLLYDSPYNSILPALYFLLCSSADR